MTATFTYTLILAAILIGKKLVVPLPPLSIKASKPVQKQENGQMKTARPMFGSKWHVAKRVFF